MSTIRMNRSVVAWIFPFGHGERTAPAVLKTDGDKCVQGPTSRAISLHFLRIAVPARHDPLTGHRTFFHADQHIAQLVPLDLPKLISGNGIDDQDFVESRIEF